MRENAAVIWDLDGVIVDTGTGHFAAWHELCRRHGRRFTEAEFRVTFGQRNEEIIEYLFDKARLGNTSLTKTSDWGWVVQTLADEKEALFRATARQHVRVLPGVPQFLAALASAGYRLAIGSSAPRVNIELLLNAVGLSSYFSTIVAAEDVAAGKPDPEIFLMAARRLGVPPACCLVIEDAAAGVIAAKAAGMACLAVTNTRDRQALAAADLVVGSLEQVDVETVASFLHCPKQNR